MSSSKDLVQDKHTFSGSRERWTDFDLTGNTKHYRLVLISNHFVNAKYYDDHHNCRILIFEDIIQDSLCNKSNLFFIANMFQICEKSPLKFCHLITILNFK